MQTILDIQQIQTGDTLLVSGKSWLAHEIQNFEKCSWNHAGMFFWLENELFIIEMDAPGLVMTHFSDYIKGKSNLLICKPDFTIDESAYRSYVFPMLGKTRYGFFNLLIAQPIKFLTNKRIWLGSLDDSPKRLICGEFVEMTYNHFNPDLFISWKRDAPSDIFNDTHFEHFLFVR
jgi:hypothetical protein